MSLKPIVLCCFLVAANSAFCQAGPDSEGVCQQRIRAVCIYVSKEIIKGRKPKLWPLYIDIPVEKYEYDSARKRMRNLPYLFPGDSGGTKYIQFADTSVAKVYDDWRKVRGGETIFLAPLRGRFIKGELKIANSFGLGGYRLLFEFDGIKIVRAYVERWEE
jgi:hypothetical protein